MNKQYVIISIIIGFILVLASCTDLKKDLPVATTGDVKIHDAGWEDDTSKMNFHGKYLKANNWNSNECKNCHGATYTGGTSGEACYQCHPSFPHEVKFVGEDGHENYMEQNGYPFSECKKCHGINLTGSTIVDVSCSQSECHSDAAGSPKSPMACNTCHGKFRALANDTTSWAPPPAVNGIENSPSVGAHQKHLATGSIGKSVKCQECHSVPDDVITSGHIDIPFNVQVAFNDTLARLKTSGGTIIPNPVFNSTSMSCSNAYCHGYFKNGNQANSPTWNIVNGTQAACGTCHGNPTTGNPLPTTTHPNDFYKNCTLCHYTGSVPVAQYNSGTNTWIINDRLKHVNGKLSRSGTEGIF